MTIQRFRATDLGRTRSDECSGLLARVSRLKLVSNGKDQDDVFGGKPPVFGDISVTSAREYEFPSALFRRPSEERMIGEKLKRLSHA